LNFFLSQTKRKTIEQEVIHIEEHHCDHLSCQFEGKLNGVIEKFDSMTLMTQEELVNIMT